MSNQQNSIKQAGNAVWAVLAVVLVLAIGGGAFFLMQDKEANTPSPQNVAEAVEQAPAETSESAEAAPAAGDATATNEAPVGEFNGTPVKPGDPVVATVDGKNVKRTDVYRFIQTMPANVQQMPATAVYPIALEQVINTRLIQNKAEAANLESDPEVQREMDMAKQQIIRNVYLERELNKRISESELKKAYKEAVKNVPDVEERKASHILVESEDKAKEIIERLKEGANFNEIAQKESQDPTAAQNAGDLGWFAKTDMVPEFANAAFALEKGQATTEPVKTQFGWHVIMLEDVRQRPKPTFEQARATIETQIRRQKLDELVQDWRKKADVEKFDINGEPVQEQETSQAPAAADDAAAQEPAAE